MRVTNKTILSNYLQNLNRNFTQMAKYNNQLSSGKEISKPSDDPFAVTRSMSLHTSINQNDQYLRNIEDSLGWVDMTDTALGGIGDVLNRTRELTIKAANTGSLSTTDKKAIQDEIKQLVGQVSQIGNSNYDGRYIFGGQKTTTPPFKVGEDGELAYTADVPDTGMLQREISQNVTMEVNVPGTRVMGEGTTLSDTFKDIIEALDSGDLADQLGEELLGQLDDHIDNILSLRAEVGAKFNRLEAAQAKNKDETLGMEDLLSKTEDIDLAEKQMQFMMMENVYIASLATGARIMQPSLLDFLR